MSLSNLLLIINIYLFCLQYIIYLFYYFDYYYLFVSLPSPALHRDGQVLRRLPNGALLQGRAAAAEEKVARCEQMFQDYTANVSVLPIERMAWVGLVGWVCVIYMN